MIQRLAEVLIARAALYVLGHPPDRWPEWRLVVEKDGDYLLQIKGNQPNLLKTASARTGGAPLLHKTAAGTDDWNSVRSP